MAMKSWRVSTIQLPEIIDIEMKARDPRSDEIFDHYSMSKGHWMNNAVVVLMDTLIATYVSQIALLPSISEL